MGNEKNQQTEAELQIDRLKRLKEQKDRKDKDRNEEVYNFRGEEAPPAGSPVADAAGTAATPQAEGKTGPGPGRRQAKKPKRSSRLDRKNYDRITRIIKKIKTENQGMRLSGDMLVNMILARVLELKLDFNGAKSPEDVRNLLARIKSE